MQIDSDFVNFYVLEMQAPTVILLHADQYPRKSWPAQAGVQRGDVGGCSQFIDFLSLKKEKLEIGEDCRDFLYPPYTEKNVNVV